MMQQYNVIFTQKDLYNHVDVERKFKIKDSDIEDALVYFCGKVELITRKDLYNHVDVERKFKIKDSDIEDALVYFCGKVELNP